MSTMNSLLDQKTPSEICLGIARRLQQRRKQYKVTQAGLSKMADVSLGSLRRFESSGEVSLKSLVKIAIALGCEQELNSLFSQRQYR